MVVRLELEEEAVEFIIAKLDQVGGTRAICNRLAVILMQTKEAMGDKQSDPPVVEDKKKKS